MEDEKREIYNLIKSLDKKQLTKLLEQMGEEFKFLKELLQIRIELM